jgi:hypothetical protein
MASEGSKPDSNVERGLKLNFCRVISQSELERLTSRVISCELKAFPMKITNEVRWRRRARYFSLFSLWMELCEWQRM